MGIRTGNSRSLFIFITILAMLAAPAFSRATLSLCMLAFLAAALLHKNIGHQMHHFFKTPLLVGMAALFLLPAISGLWSDNTKEWSRLVRIKLPLLLLPVAFAGSWQLAAKQWRAVALFFTVLILAGTIWSFQKYWIARDAISESYLRAKVFLTPLENDHVRFSWLVAVAALVCLWFMENGRRRMKWTAGVGLIWFTGYLHLLAARTGLFSLYLILVFYVIRRIRQSRSKIIRSVAILLMVAAPLLAWQLLPTFQNRIKYFVYDYSFIRNGTYLPGGNDGNRMLSFRAGWHLLKTHPFGVGAGDVFTETNNWYITHVPGMLQTDKLYPSSEWLLHGGSTGWPGVLIFTGIMLLPFFYRPSSHLFYWYALCGTAAASLLFDIGLEVQYGVFVYALPVLWWWKWFTSENKAS